MRLLNGEIMSALDRQAYPEWIIWLLLPVLWLVSDTSWADETASVKTTVARAWKARENQVSTLNCEWSATNVCGARIWVYHDEQGKQFAIPPNDLTTSATYRFRLQGNRKMRFEYTGAQPIQETRSFETRGYVSVTDGEEQKSFYDKDKVSEESRFPPHGFINKERTLPEKMTIHLWPLLMVYRPSTPEVAPELDLTKFSPKGQITIAGRPCLLLESIGSGVGKHELVIDMKRDCVPVRLRDLSRDGSTATNAWHAGSLIEIDYVDRADGGWALAGWKTAIMGEGGKIREQMKAVVTKIEINVDVPDSVFQFDFPAGTVVWDWKRNERYLLREGGEKRYITDAESNARVPYKQLLTTKTGESLGSRGRFLPTFLLVGSGGLLSWIAWLIYSKYRRRRNAP